MTTFDDLREQYYGIQAIIMQVPSAKLQTAARAALALLWKEVREAQPLKVARSVDTACLDEIGAILDGTYWDCDTPVLIADIVRRSGREVRPPPGETTLAEQMHLPKDATDYDDQACDPRPACGASACIQGWIEDGRAKCVCPPKDNEPHGQPVD